LAFINWDDSYSVGIAHLDDQHKGLISLLNELNDKMRLGKGKEITGIIIQKLIEYAGMHFSSEERLFDEHGYQGSIDHRKEHRAFVEKVLAFQKDLQSDKLFLSIEIMNFLKEWLINHILRTDKNYGPFLNSKGIK
jgi:hemerythrin